MRETVLYFVHCLDPCVLYGDKEAGSINSSKMFYSTKTMLHWQLLLYDLRFLYLNSILHQAFQWTSWHQHNPARRSKKLSLALSYRIVTLHRCTHDLMAVSQFYCILNFTFKNITDWSTFMRTWKQMYKYINICLKPFIFWLCMAVAHKAIIHSPFH